MEHVWVLLIYVAPVVWCYSSGQVGESCEDMRPHHAGVSPQSVASPFTVTADRSSYKLGEEVKVQLEAPASTPFVGFLLQAREVGGGSPVGTFTLISGSTQFLSCGQKPNSAVSHTSESGKTSVLVKWTSDTSAAGAKPIQFHASFVQNYMTFWVGVRSPVLTFSGDSVGGSADPSIAPTTTTTIYSPATPAKYISSADCGVTKVCFSQPPNCDPTVSSDCYFMSARMSHNDAAIHFEMTGTSDGYVSFGFSDDRRMGNDDIYICGIGSNGLVQVQHAFSTGRTAPQLLPLGNVSDIRASVQDRVISCSFTSMNTLSTQRTTGFNETYYLLFAQGASSNGQIRLHTTTFISAEKVDISRPRLIREAGWPHIIKAHGALMLIAWMTLGSVGMLVARYLKGMAKGQNLCGKDVWFLLHVAVMTVAVAATAVGFILSFSYAKVWSGGAHPVLGCLVMILSVLQPIMALLRCGPQHPLRFLFNWSHALNGVAIKALSVAAIFTGLQLIDSTLNQWLVKVMGGFVGWEALFFILFEVNLRWNMSRADTLDSKPVHLAVLLMAPFLLGNISFLVALLVGIGKS